MALWSPQCLTWPCEEEQDVVRLVRPGRNEQSKDEQVRDQYPALWQRLHALIFVYPAHHVQSAPSAPLLPPSRTHSTQP